MGKDAEEISIKILTEEDVLSFANGPVNNPVPFSQDYMRNPREEVGGIFCRKFFKSSESNQFPLGFIKLARPIMHPWFLCSHISLISLILGKDTNAILNQITKNGFETLNEAIMSLDFEMAEYNKKKGQIVRL